MIPKHQWFCFASERTLWGDSWLLDPTFEASFFRRAHLVLEAAPRGTSHVRVRHGGQDSWPNGEYFGMLEIFQAASTKTCRSKELFEDDHRSLAPNTTRRLKKTVHTSALHTTRRLLATDQSYRRISRPIPCNRVQFSRVEQGPIMLKTRVVRS